MKSLGKVLRQCSCLILEASDNVAATGKRILSVPFAGDDRMISVPHGAVRPLNPPDKQLVPNLRSKVFSK